VNDRTPSVGRGHDAHSDLLLLTSSKSSFLSSQFFPFAGGERSLWRLRYHCRYCTSIFRLCQFLQNAEVGLCAASKLVTGVLASGEFVGIELQRVDESLGD